MQKHQIINADCTTALETLTEAIDLTFLDPPFNQNKHYKKHDDNLPEAAYWQWMMVICEQIYHHSSDGAAIYFMQREKNTAQVMQCLAEAGWSYQNLIIWKKMTSAVPSNIRYGKQFQVIVFATKGKKPRVFNKLRIDPVLPANYKYKRENGIYVTDIWDDIRELTSGYFAGDEALRSDDGSRFHKQQAPLALLLRILLSSSNPDDVILDPFAGTGTTSVVAKQLERHSIAIELDPDNAACIKQRLEQPREADDISRYYADYTCTENLAEIWHTDVISSIEQNEPADDVFDLPLFQAPHSE